MAQSAEELLTAIKSYARGMIKGNTVDTLGAPIDIINEAIVKPALNIIGAKSLVTDAPVGGSKSLRKLFNQPVEDANPAETVGSMISAAGALKAIVIPAFLTRSVKEVKAAQEGLKGGQQTDELFRLPIHVDDGIIRTVLNPRVASIKPEALQSSGTAIRDGHVFTLPEVINFPELYSLVPSLKSTYIGHAPEMSFGGASYNPSNNYISVGKQSSPTELLQAILHETQHGVQNKYGMNGGASPNSFFADPKTFNAARMRAGDSLEDVFNQSRNLYRRVAGEAEARAVESMSTAYYPKGPNALEYYGRPEYRETLITGPQSVRPLDQDPVIQAIIRDALASKK